MTRITDVVMVSVLNQISDFPGGLLYQRPNSAAARPEPARTKLSGMVAMVPALLVVEVLEALVELPEAVAVPDAPLQLFAP